MLSMPSLLHAANNSHITFAQLDPSSISFSQTIENIYKVHALHLISSARRYEEKYKKKSSISQLYKVISGKTLTDLSALTSLEIKDLCVYEDIQLYFDQAYLAAQSSKAVDDRVASWLTFVSRLYENRDRVIRDKFPGIWFAQKGGRAVDDDFVKKNENITFDWAQGKYLIASKVITFLPFALIQQHDPEAFVAFLEARGG
jgi:hypothetical protein